jgi:hypothetical protein
MRQSAGQDTKTRNEAQRQLKMTCLAACTHHLRPFRACPGLRSQPGAPPSSGSCLHAASADGLRARAPWQGLAAPTERLHTRRLRHTWHARSGTHGRPAPAPAHSLYRALHRPPADSAIGGGSLSQTRFALTGISVVRFLTNYQYFFFI